MGWDGREGTRALFFVGSASCNLLLMMSLLFLLLDRFLVLLLFISVIHFFKFVLFYEIFFQVFNAMMLTIALMLRVLWEAELPLTEIHKQLPLSLSCRTTTKE